MEVIRIKSKMVRVSLIEYFIYPFPGSFVDFFKLNEVFMVNGTNYLLLINYLICEDEDFLVIVDY